MRVLLTGAAGFIGTEIGNQLRQAGHDVLGVDLLIPAAHGEAPAPQREDLIVADVRDEQAMARLLDGVDVVCHQAAMVGLGVKATDAPDYASHNVLGTASLLSAMARAGVGRIVYASSMVVYGEGLYRCELHGSIRPAQRRAADLDAGVFDPRCPRCDWVLAWETVTEDAATDPRNTYATTKLACEHLAFAWAQQTGGNATGLRYHNVYGPGMPRDTPYAGVASIFRSALESGVAPRVYEDGNQMRDFIHVSDISRANLAAIDRSIALPVGEPDLLLCNVASGRPHSVGEMASALATAMAGAAPEVVGGGRIGDVRHVVGSADLAARELGFTAQVGFTEGMTEFATVTMRAPVS